MKKFIRSKKARYFVAGIIIIAILIAIFGRGSTPAYEFLKAERATLTQEVAVTGNTKAVQDLQLSFDASGKVARVYAVVGQRVTPGAALAALDSGELAAKYAGSVAQVKTQTAKLDQLKRGSRAEDIEIKRTELQKAEVDLSNEYLGVVDTINDAYIKSDDAVRKQLDALFENEDTGLPQLSFPINGSQLKNDTEAARSSAGGDLKAWKAEIDRVSAAPEAQALEVALAASEKRTATVLTLLNIVGDAITKNVALSSSLVETYRANVTTAKTNVNAAKNALNSKHQILESNKIAVKKAKDQLNLLLAGSAPEDIRAQEAAVEEAQAASDGAAAALSKMTIRSPIAGIVTRQDAKLGQIASANTPLIWVISDKDLEIESNVPEVDIGKVQTGQTVIVTFDAFPGETFSGTVSFIDPAETIVDGVVNYKIKVAFIEKSDRLKSGLTANLRIQTLKKEGTLVLPQLGVLETDTGTFVRRLVDGEVKDIPVRLGVRGANGDVEILEGISEGDEVINVGIKEKE